MYNAEDTLQEGLSHPDDFVRARAMTCRAHLDALEGDLDRAATAREHAAVVRAQYAVTGLS